MTCSPDPERRRGAAQGAGRVQVHARAAPRGAGGGAVRRQESRSVRPLQRRRLHEPHGGRGGGGQGPGTGPPPCYTLITPVHSSPLQSTPVHSSPLQSTFSSAPLDLSRRHAPPVITQGIPLYRQGAAQLQLNREGTSVRPWGAGGDPHGADAQGGVRVVVVSVRPQHQGALRRGRRHRLPGRGTPASHHTTPPPCHNLIAISRCVPPVTTLTLLHHLLILT